jgi:hypothetical protein
MFRYGNVSIRQNDPGLLTRGRAKAKGTWTANLIAECVRSPDLLSGRNGTQLIYIDHRKWPNF